MNPDDDQRPAPTAKGRLEKTPVVNLVLYALDRRLSGTIEFESPNGASASILFDEGKPSKAKISDPCHFLGEVLVSLQAIDEPMCRRSLSVVLERKRLHGELLREAGAISQEQLLLGLREQLLRKLLHIAAFSTQTSFQYFDAFDPLANYGGEEIVELDPLPFVWSDCARPPLGIT